MRGTKVLLDVDAVRAKADATGRTYADISRAMGHSGGYLNGLITFGAILEMRLPILCRELNCEPDDIIVKEEREPEPVRNESAGGVTEMIERLEKKIDQLQFDIDNLDRMLLFVRWVGKNIAESNGWGDNRREA